MSASGKINALAEFESLSRWVVWRNEPRGDGITKVPYNPRFPDSKAMADTPQTWGTLQAAQDAAPTVVNGSGGGVGIQLGDLGDGTALGGLDLDTCRNSAGVFEPWAQAIITRFETYAEVSPSLTGGKLFFRYDADAKATIVAAMGGPKHGKSWKPKGGGKHPPAIELHLSNRFFVTTFARIPDAPDKLRVVPPELLLELIQQTGPAFAGGGTEGAEGRPQGKGGRSEAAFAMGLSLRRAGATFEAMVAALQADPTTAEWAREKGGAFDGREFRRIWKKAAPPINSPWLSKCLFGENGEVLPILANVAIALEEDPRFRDCLSYDQMTCTTLFDGVPVQDVDESRLQRQMQNAGLKRISQGVTQQAIAMRARDRAFHPVRDYLNGLCWDGVERVSKWLSYYLGAEPSPYVEAIGRMFLIAMVARVMQPGCKADYMLVLEGEQGEGKSSACATLAGQWFSDNLPALDRADPVRLSMHLRGKWLIEIGEMSSIKRAEAEALKAFLTQTVERYTPKYGHNETAEPRQCVFIGTTNKKAYLRDETGGRRFWPVETGQLDLPALAHDRDQLLAETAILYGKGVPWHPTRVFELQYIRPQQDARYEADPWEEAIANYLAPRHETTPNAVAKEALSLENVRFGSLEQRRISRTMTQLGWVAGKPEKHRRPWIKKPTN